MSQEFGFVYVDGTLVDDVLSGSPTYEDCLEYANQWQWGLDEDDEIECDYEVYVIGDGPIGDDEYFTDEELWNFENEDVLITRIEGRNLNWELLESGTVYVKIRDLEELEY